MANTGKMKVGVVGICSVCEEEFKTKDERMVHHGYLRPGDGEIHGDCYGVGYKAYELSTKGCEGYRRLQWEHLMQAQKRLEALPSTMYFRETHVTSRGVVSYTEYAAGVTDPYRWFEHLDYVTRCTKQRIVATEREVARMDGLIARWKLGELRVVTEEHVERAKADSAAKKKADKDERLAAKRAKRDAIAAKRAASLAKRAAIVEPLLLGIEAIEKDDLPQKKDRALSAYRFFQNVKKKNEMALGYCSIPVEVLGGRDRAQVFVRLGIARNYVAFDKSEEILICS